MHTEWLLKPRKLRKISRLFCAQAFSRFPAQLSLLWDRRWEFKPGWSGIASAQIILHCRKRKNELRVMSRSSSDWAMSHVQKVYFFHILFKMFTLQRQFFLSEYCYYLMPVWLILSNSLTLVFLQVPCKHTPSWTSPFLFSCMAISKLLCKILLSVLIQSSISASLSAANRYVLLSCIFSSKANRRTLLFCSHTAEEVRKKGDKLGADNSILNYIEIRAKSGLRPKTENKFFWLLKPRAGSGFSSALGSDMTDKEKKSRFSNPNVDMAKLNECFIFLSKANTEWL